MLRKMMLKDLDEVMTIWLEINCVAMILFHLNIG